MPVTDWTTTPLGTSSLTTTLVAADGPAFDAVSVQVMVVPAITGLGAAVFVSERSETARMVSDVDAVLLAGFGRVSGSTP